MERHVCLQESQWWDILALSQPYTSLSLVLQTWTWAQVCTLALHEEKGMENTENLTMEAFLLGKANMTKGSTLVKVFPLPYQHVTLGEPYLFSLDRSP